MATRRRLAIIHIGVIKTGSTAIQGWLQFQRPALEARGVRYVAAFGRRHHGALADALRDAAAARRGPSEGRLGELLGAFAAEVAALPPAVQTLILSSEHFSGLPEEAVLRLRDAIVQHVEQVRIVVYLRRQDEFAVSRFSNMIRGGQAPRSPMEVPPPRYDVLLERWEAAFGAAALLPRIYAEGRLEGGDAVADFLAATGLADLPRPPASDRPNPNLLPAGIALLRRVNAALERTGLDAAEADRIRNHLAAVLQDIAPGGGELPSRREAEDYVARCAEANERVRARWFPAAETLFPMDFARYPQTPSLGPTLEDLLDLAVRSIVAIEAPGQKVTPGT